MLTELDLANIKRDRVKENNERECPSTGEMDQPRREKEPFLGQEERPGSDQLFHLLIRPNKGC